MATLPVSNIAVSSGAISRAKPRAKMPPTVEPAPCLVSSAATWMLNTVPAAMPMISTTKKLEGPASIRFSLSSPIGTRPRAAAANAWPPIRQLLPRRRSQRGVRSAIAAQCVTSERVGTLLGQSRITTRPNTTSTAGIRPMQRRMVISAEVG